MQVSQCSFSSKTLTAVSTYNVHDRSMAMSYECVGCLGVDKPGGVSVSDLLVPTRGLQGTVRLPQWIVSGTR